MGFVLLYIASNEGDVVMNYNENKRSKINSSMSLKEILLVMCEGNPGALNVLLQMMESHIGLLNIFLLDTLDIRGPKIWMLYKDCSGQDMDKFYRTLDLIRGGAFSREEIDANFELPYAIPFLDDSVKKEDFAKEDEILDVFHPNWNKYTKANRDIFVPKLQERMESFGGMGRSR